MIAVDVTSSEFMLRTAIFPFLSTRATGRRESPELKESKPITVYPLITGGVISIPK